MLTISCSLLTTTLKMKTRMVVAQGTDGYRIVVSVSAVYSHDGMAVWELWLTAAAQHCQSIILCIASPGKDKNSKYSF